ncbi:AMP-binding enzyme, putative [Synechococcus sp. PCC 7335]|uniref:fatty acyl-AMP ligase n=1 Tax=Synechococcus sp. (strain ATCC 29403 / PCC 7335) TaxID=91464 RepID=UPI00017EB7E0|nr:fatty acyl-AMP ligase [Synechococcus sp. PCC 7335]EDX87497.1 AMP-binding enzyme, putative [Synechococcus sp. PCC 7335]
MAFPLSSHPTQLDHCASLVEILRYRAEQQPNQIAYIGLENGESEYGRLTYYQLDIQARAIAAHLQSLGASGARVLLTFPLSDGLAFTSAFFGCLYAGAVAVTAWPPLNESLLLELQYKAVDAQIQFALTTQPLMERLSEPFVVTPPLDQIHWIEVDQLGGKNANSWQMPKLEDKTLAYLQYTSGSTGLPKGAMISHGNVLNNLAMIQAACQYTASDIGICWLPLYHDLGLVCAVTQPIYVGRPVVMMSPVDFILKPLRWLQAISRYRGTISGGPNFAFELCLRKITPEQRKGLDLSSWAIAANGAEPVLPDTLDRFASAFAPAGFRKAAFCPAYGMAETTVMITTTPRNCSPVVKSIQRSALEKNKIVAAPTENISENVSEARKVVSCGKTGENHQIAIVDPDTLKQCAEDEVGEVWVSGPSVAQGYFNREEQTEQTFQAHTAAGEGPFLRTGDMGFLQGDELFITGRLKDVIILWGNNHYPHFIETTVEKSHPTLRPAGVAVFGVAVDEEERLVVVQEIESRYLRSLDVESVVGAIRQSLAMHHMLEAHAIALVRPGSTPKTPTGKVQRTTCKSKYLTGELNIIYEWKNARSAEGILLDPTLMSIEL